MGEKGNLAGGHVPVTQTSAPSPQGGGGGGGLLDAITDQAEDKVTDIGLGGKGLGIVKHDDDEES